MPECSHVHIEVPTWGAPILHTATHATGITTHPDDGHQIELTDWPWGAGAQSLEGLRGRLTIAETPWVIYDAGNYDWNPHLIAWTPTLGNIRYDTDTDGNILIDTPTTRDLLTLDTDTANEHLTRLELLDEDIHHWPPPTSHQPTPEWATTTWNHYIATHPDRIAALNHALANTSTAPTDGGSNAES